MVILASFPISLFAPLFFSEIIRGKARREKKTGGESEPEPKPVSGWCSSKVKDIFFKIKKRN